MQGRIAALDALQQGHPDIARELERVKNYLGDLQREFNSWLQAPDASGLGALRDLCLELLKNLRVLRVPLIINEKHLRRLRVGQQFDFMAHYQQDLYGDLGQDLRRDVLHRLKEDRNLLGWVDQEAGIIYRLSNRAGRKLLSFGLVLGLPVLGLILYVAIAPLLQPEGGDWSHWAIAVNYVFFFAGYVGHLFKKAMEGTKDPLLDDIVSWIHVRELHLAVMGASMLAVYAVLGGFGIFPDLGLYAEISTTSAFTALVGGFSIDSVGAGALKQYQRKVSAEVTALKGALEA